MLVGGSIPPVSTILVILAAIPSATVIIFSTLHGYILTGFVQSALHVSNYVDAETTAHSLFSLSFFFVNLHLPVGFSHSIPSFSSQIWLITKDAPLLTRFIYVSPEHWHLFGLSRSLNCQEILGKYMYLGVEDEDRLCLLVHYYLGDRPPTWINNYNTVPLSGDFMQGVYAHRWPDRVEYTHLYY